MRYLTMTAVVILLVALAPEASGKSGTPITSCGQTVTTSAVLVQDLFCNGDGIVVGASKITIDMNQHTLYGDGDLGDRGVDTPVCCDNVTVKNGVIRDFGWGVAADGADHLRVQNVDVSGNTIGIDLPNGTSDSISSSTALGNTIGIFIGAQKTTVTSSIATGNQIYGVSDSGVGNKFKSVTASGNGSDGIQISVPASDTTITSSTASGNGSDGINVRTGTASITSSTADGNGSVGIEVASDSATLKNNIANGNGYDHDVAAIHPFDLQGLGISVTGLNPTGRNTAYGNDDDAECEPSYLC